MLAMDDYMLRSEDESVADTLHSLTVSNFRQDRKGGDLVQRLGQEDLMLVDGGFRRNSVITEIAKIMLQRAEPGTVYFMSQYRPRGTMAEALKNSQPVFSAFNAVDEVDGVIGWQQGLYVFDHEKFNAIHPRRMTHSKAIVATLKEDISEHGVRFLAGQRVALSTSSNMHDWGVWGGTAEIALVTGQENVVNQIDKWAEKTYLRTAA
jgi:hypothetical protein